MPSLLPFYRCFRPVLFLALALLAASQTGCVRRRLTLRTFPPGAQVFIDNQEVGITPCSTAFIYYGTRNMTIIKDGYKTENLSQTFYPPWYQYPPLDFITENLLITELRDERVVDVQLVPQEVVAPAALLQRAEGLRTGTRTGQVTALPNVPPGAAPASGPAPAKVGLPGEGLPGYEPQPYIPLPNQPFTPPPGSVPLQRYPQPEPGAIREPGPGYGKI